MTADNPTSTSLPPEHEALFYRGLHLFNQRQFFEAHEVWEDLWRPLPQGQPKRFYQGLIQCAVALLHAQRGNSTGARRVWLRAQGKFQGLPATYLGLTIAPFLADMSHFLAPMLTTTPTTPAISTLDFSQAPQIRLDCSL